MTGSDLDLMRLYDGELSPEEESELTALLERDETARARLRALQDLGDLVRTCGAEGRDDAAFVDSIMSHVEADAENAPRTRRRRVVTLVVPLAGVAAMAAAAALVLSRAEPPRDAQPVAANTTVVVAPAAPPSPSEPAPSVHEPSVAIESVEFGEQTGAIFMVGSSSGETPVIWLTDSAPNRTRMKPL